MSHAIIRDEITRFQKKTSISSKFVLVKDETDLLPTES
jgi:hypothetical protein